MTYHKTEQQYPSALKRPYKMCKSYSSNTWRLSALAGRRLDALKNAKVWNNPIYQRYFLKIQILFLQYISRKESNKVAYFQNRCQK